MQTNTVMEPNPLSIILVKSDSKGDRLLFRYPYAADARNEAGHQSRRRNPYALTITEDLLQTPPPQTSNICKGHLTGFSDEVLSTLFAVKPELCERKFELKVNDVRFVGHPTLLSDSIILTNIVFALHATASHSIVKCYYDLSKRLGVALRHEERRCGYLSQETKTMVMAHDEVSARPEGEKADDADTPFDLILQRSTLARNLKSVYDDLISTGLVHVRVNRWIEVSFCLPQKVHQFYKKDFIIEPESIHRCLQSLRPYHGLLLLVESNELLDHMHPDASPALVRLIRMYSPLKSLQTLAADADLTLSQMFQLAGHLLYWAKATVIYPLCESNVYVIAPDAPTHVNSPLTERFSEHFPGMNLLQVMSDFSLPTSISQKMNPLNHPQHQKQLVQMIVWMLQHRLLLQLHTYVYFMPTASGPSLPQDGLGRQHSHSLHHSSTRDGSYQSTPDEQLSISVGGLMGGRAPSESDLSSNISDDVLVTPGNKLNGLPIQTSGSLVSTDNEVSFVNVLEEEKSSLVREELLADFSDEERTAILKIPAAANPEDLLLLAQLCRMGYLRGCHHLEEIMYLENIRRSQLLQLLDKFRDVLVTCETEDPAIALFYSHSYT
ncbi:GATOR complex protein NPRL3 isoform X2 [Zootermopsis nevadensis]|uniref:GATOR complex protein NPRL3 isoform X2 n=1 Tax=Zootermopsis nevadensis TaxID=136037 RepID=UPI000B8E469A|nr:GATOR complex protein NPRL3 isoform X2 [Zootermopsis nevadensis]